MSNPAKLVSSFGGSLAYTDQAGSGSWTGVDPIRYDSGLWLEQSGANYVPNPVAAVDTAGWSAQSSITMTAESVLPGPLPGWLASLVTTGYKLTATADKTGGSLAVSSQSLIGSAAVHQLAVFIWVPTAFSATGVGVLASNFTGSSASESLVDLSKRDQWQHVPASLTPDVGDLSGSIRIRPTTGTMLSGETLWFTLAEIAPGSYLTSPIAETLGTGYANTGAAHNSPSTRAASSASVATANHIDPSSGSLAFRFRRLIDTGGVETLLECGTDGDDWMKMYIDASDKLNLWWASGGALPTYVTSAESIAVDTEYFVYAEWDGNTQALSINNGAKVVGTRDTVVGDWGAGPLTLKAE